MNRYYKVENPCKKCSRKGIFVLTEEEASDWQCPFDSPDCSGELKASSWLEKHRKRLLQVGGVVGVVVLLLGLLRETDADQLREKMTGVEKAVQAFGSDVRKLPQNTGNANPYEQRWINRYSNRIKLFESKIEPIREDLEKLKEFKDAMEAEIAKAEEMAVPEFEAPMPLKKYGDLKAEGIRLLSRTRSVKQQAKRQDERSVLARGNRCERQINTGLATLKRKSEPSGEASSPEDPATVKKSYVSKLNGVKGDVDQAILAEVERRKRLAEEAERRRLEELERQRRLSEMQRLAEWNAAAPDFSIVVAASLRGALIEALVIAYLENGGDEQCKALSSPHEGEEDIKRYAAGGRAIEVAAAAGAAVSPLQVEIRDRAASRKNSRVIAMDAMVVVAGPMAPSALVAGDLEEIIAGRIGNWSQVGGGNAPIRVISPALESSDHAVISEDIQALLAQNSAAQKSASVAKDSAGNPSAFGICSFHNSGGHQRIPVRASKNSSVFAPTPSAISSENYRYAKRVYADLPENAPAAMSAFLDYVEGPEGQRVVSERGFIDLRIELVSEPLDDFALPIIAKAFGVDVSDILSAYRLNTNFRFATASSELDSKAKADVERVQQTLNIHLGTKKKALVVGFADSDGTEEYNLGLSKDRAVQVKGTLLPKVRDTSSVGSAGEGEKYPIADNDTDLGKSQNRRVEVWIVELN